MFVATWPKCAKAPDAAGAFAFEGERARSLIGSGRLCAAASKSNSGGGTDALPAARGRPTWPGHTHSGLRAI